MTIKVDRKPTSESLLVCLDKKTGVRESGLIDPKNMGKTEALGTVVAIGENTKGFKVGDRIHLPVNQQKDTFIYEGNTFCTVHYSYITLFVVDEYEVDTEKKSIQSVESNLRKIKMVLGHTKGDIIRVYYQDGRELTRTEIEAWFNFQYENLK